MSDDNGSRMTAHVVEKEIAGRTLRLETGKLAKQAAGAVVVTYGETVLLTAVAEGKPRGTDFFPLQVDYRERAYATGRFPGGYKKREGPPSMKEILTMRLTDRPIRPLFPKGYINEVQISTTVYAGDRENDADVLSMTGASAALSVSDLPFRGPIAAVRIGRVDGELVVLPTAQDLEQSDLDLVVAGSATEVCMIEGFAREMAEDDMVDAIMLAHEVIRDLIDMQKQLQKKAGVKPREPEKEEDNPLLGKVKDGFYSAIRGAVNTVDKLERKSGLDKVFGSVKEQLLHVDEKSGESNEAHLDAATRYLKRQAVRESILEGTRPDGRSATDLRPLYSEVGLMERVHGSSLFQRGETQALCVATLGGGGDEQRVGDGLFDEYSKKFMLDYNFPHFSVGETGPIRGPGRREIGHGALAERSVKPVVPPPEKFPYTIRLVSEILESNGSSSMASVCAATLCLMDAGVPIKDPVAGISIGLIQEGDRKILLTDIMGDEDHYGDMDFKVAGTQRGITGIQLDLKIGGIDEDVIRGALAQARKSRITILKHMLTTLKRPRKELNQHAPLVLQLRINKEKIGAIIGPGGKNIRAMQDDTGSQINIDDDGIVTILGTDKAGAEDARNRIEAITADVQVGRVYKGRVNSVTDFGAFVEIVPGRDGLCHISELDHGYVSRVQDVCKVGDQMEVKVIGIDDHDRVKLSRKALLDKPEGDDDDDNGDDDRGGRDRDDRGGRDRGGDRGGRSRGGRDRESSRSRR